MNKFKHTKRIDVNVVIEGEHLKVGDAELLFGDEEVCRLPANTRMIDILVESGVAKSKTQARGLIVKRYEREGFENNKNGEPELIDIYIKVKAVEESIQTGYSEYVIGKFNHWISIWNPSN